MSAPNVTVKKNTFTTVSAPNNPTGILAIAACSSSGTVNQPKGFSRSDLAVNQFGQGPLVEFNAFVLPISGQSTVLCKGTSTFSGSYNGLQSTSTGSTVGTSGSPYDHYAIFGTVVNGGTVGVSGITIQFTDQNGTPIGGLQNLGTATSLAVPGTGATFTFTSAALKTGDTFSVNTERPMMGDTDLLAALTALGKSRLPYEGVLADSSCTVSTVGLVDTFLSGQEAKGQFKFVLLNSRMLVEAPNAEDEGTYLTALTTLFGNQTSIRVCVGADGGHSDSQISGISGKRPTSLYLAARAMAIPLGQDPAFVANNVLSGVSVSDGNGNPLDHDEDVNPGLDSQRFVTLRTFAPGGPQGVYITNANTMQPSGGNFPYLQHIRIANRACSIAWYVLTTQLSRGVRKNLKADPVTGAVYILEQDAAAIETLVNDAVNQALKGQVNAVKFTLSRTDDLSVTPVTLNGTLSIQALAYVKGYAVAQQFVKALTTTV